jgi:hypothetical protein
VNENNVVPFAIASRGGMARRGAPDKGSRRFGKLMKIECPECRAVLWLDAARPPIGPEVFCGGCETALPLVALARESRGR